MDNNIHFKEVLDLEINIDYILRRIEEDPVVFYSFFKI